MLGRLNLLHHDHSGRLRAHEHTSYLPLGILLLIVGFALAVYSVQAAPPPPGEGSVGLSGEMPGPPPTEAATIQTPKDGQRFDISPITVSGTCPTGTLVEIFKNDIFAGSTFCSEKGTYSIQIDLMYGQNTLIVRVYDALNQPGPDSAPVTVFFDALPPQAGPLVSLEFGSAQLLLSTDAVYRGLFPEKQFAMPLDILGGTPPYAVNIQWGDANNSVVSRNNDAGFNADHAYVKPGTYQIAVKASDTTGRVAFLTVAALVNGQPSPAPQTASAAPPNQLLLLWPVYTSLIGILVAFWLGERREKHMLSKHGLLLPPQV